MQGGGTEADHLATHARATGEMPDELTTFISGPPPGTESVWLAFKELNRARGNNGFGPVPISWESIATFAMLYGIQFTPWEIEVLGELDQAVMMQRKAQLPKEEK